MPPVSDDVVVVEPVVTVEKLRALLAVGCEVSNLDYKRRVDLDERAELVEFAKDVAAMRSCGGYLVIGADDHGTPTDLMDEALSKKFDEANLRPKLDRLLHRTDVVSAQHVIDDHHMVLVYVPRHPLGFTVVKALGDYGRPGGRGPKTVMRPGDVFVRNGTSSERWAEGDVERLLAPRDSAQREAHRTEFAAMVAAIQTGAQGQSVAAGPVQALVWQLDQGTFDGAVVELLRRADTVPIRLFLVRVPGEALAAAKGGDRDVFDSILDRIVSLGAIALTLGRGDLVTDVIDCLAQLYSSTALNGGGTMLPPQLVWLDILSRVMALGGLAVVLKEWATVRILAIQSAPVAYYASWLRHGLTEAARAGAFPTTTAGQREASLIPLARRVAHHLPALRPYVVDDEAYDVEPNAPISESDPVLDSLCAFDALAALVVLTSLDANRGFWASQYYPSFGHYYSRRSEPYWARLLRDDAMRASLLPGVDNNTLGRAMAGASDEARQVMQFRWGLWETHDEKVNEFIGDWRRRDAERGAAGPDL